MNNPALDLAKGMIAKAEEGMPKLEAASDTSALSDTCTICGKGAPRGRHWSDCPKWRPMPPQLPMTGKRRSERSWREIRKEGL